MLRRVLCFAAVLFLLPAAALAEGPYFSYTFDWTGGAPASVQTAAGYLPDGVYTGSILGTDNFSSPTDLFTAPDGRIYVLDAGNRRLVVLREEVYKLVLEREIIPVYPDGVIVPLEDPQGLFVTGDGTIYIADTVAKTVWILDAGGVWTGQIDTPVSDILVTGFDYRPANVLKDSSGIIYVLSTGSYAGALIFASNGDFLGYFGSETVRPSFLQVVQRMWSIFMSERQRERMTTNVPTTINNFDLDDRDFVYTVRDNVVSDRGQLRKLNAMGRNVLRSNWGHGDTYSFGDVIHHIDPQRGWISTNLIDVSVDDHGFINVLDYTRSRVFQYDGQCNLLFVFGGADNKQGTFRNVKAIESLGDAVLVLDDEFNTITLFRPTRYAQIVRSAVMLHGEGRYQEAAVLWEEVLRYDITLQIANVGMGRAMMQLGDYQEAMRYFKLAHSRAGYSDALYFFRAEWSREHFVLLSLIFLGIVIALSALVIIRGKRKVDHYASIGGKWKFPFYCMFHPFKGYADMKQEKKGSVLYANVIVGAFFVVSVIVWWGTAFHYNFNDPESFNVFFHFGSTAGLFAAWAITNWAVGAIMDGESTFKETWCFSAYAILPYVVVSIPTVLLSYIFTFEEYSFYAMAQGLGIAWSVLSMVAAMREAHQFNLKKTVLTSGMTLFGMILVVAVVAITYSMLTQLFSFITAIINELALRA